MKTTKRNLSKYILREKIAKALAHAARLQILDLTQHNELSVTELTEIIGLDQSTVSKHLGILKNAGLIQKRQQGTTHYYSVSCSCLDHFFECMESLVNRKNKTNTVKKCVNQKTGCKTC